MTENFTDNFAGITRPPAFAGGLLRAFFRPAHARGVQGLSAGASAAQGVRGGCAGRWLYRARRGAFSWGGAADRSSRGRARRRAARTRRRRRARSPRTHRRAPRRRARRKTRIRPSFPLFASFFPFFPSMRRPPARYAPRGSAFYPVGRHVSCGGRALFVCAGGSFCTEGGGGARRRLQKPMNLSSFSLSRLTGAFNGVIRGRPKIKSQKHAQIALLFGRNMV